VFSQRERLHSFAQALYVLTVTPAAAEIVKNATMTRNLSVQRSGKGCPVNTSRQAYAFYRSL